METTESNPGGNTKPPLFVKNSDDDPNLFTAQNASGDDKSTADKAGTQP